MTNRFHCPNPTCSYVFDPSQFPPGITMLGCPVCGIRFPYQPVAMQGPAPVPPPPAPMPIAPPAPTGYPGYPAPTSASGAANPFAATSEMPGQTPGYPPPGYPQQPVPQPGYPQPGYPQQGYPQPGSPQPGYPQPAPTEAYQAPPAAQPGYAPPGYDPYAAPATTPGAYDPYAAQPGYAPPGYDPYASQPTAPGGFDPNAPQGYGYAPPNEFGSPTAPTGNPTAGGERVINVGDVPKSGSGGLVIGLFLMMITIGVSTIYIMTKKNPFSTRNIENSTDFSSDIYNFTFQVPSAPWSSDAPDARTGLRINIFAYVNNDTGAGFAMAAQDFKERNPRDREIELGLRDRLNNYFKNAASELIPNAKWIGQPALAYQFLAELNGEQVSGECYAIRNLGVGYWWFQWAPNNAYTQGLKQEFESYRNRVTFQKWRESWKEQSNIVLFTSDNGKYQVEDADGFWQPLRKGTALPEGAVLGIEAQYKEVTGDRKPRADLNIYVLKETGDPKEVGRKFIQKMLEEDAALSEAKVTFEPVNGELPADAGKPPLEVVRFTTRNSLDADRAELYVIAGISDGSSTVVAVGRCKQSLKRLWEPWLVKIVGSLKKT
ncbi:BRcat domain-containing protein [Tuwongella immobilis]|uniref:Uncharacterized protein n=1 Tax=Tuwongella immobilis TaxID=692036 RepID=A0A6C2YSF8_9BACT|nr:IBR domain-containing protein [Tuwongella immobilis]VIP04277.1 unnamed protein product [Tuwongella immobilis]VTS05917.1 unnamed protein product [Tuwongella immobilis]